MKAEIAYTPTPAPADVAVQIYAYLANSPGVSYVKNRLALVYTSAAAAASPANIWSDLENRFGTPQVGQVLHFALRALDSKTGLVSATFSACEPVA